MMIKLAELRAKVRKDWNESDHPRGQPDNAGQFGSGGGKDKPDSSGPSKAKLVFGGDRKETETEWKSLMGDVPIEQATSLVGALDDATVTVSGGKGTGILIEVNHSTYESFRSIDVDKDGKTFIYNNAFDVKKGSQGKGIGADVFSRQVEAAQAAGVDYIKCNAGKDNGMNGYYTWPRFGYDASLDDPDNIPKSYEARKAYESARKQFPEAKTVLDIMQTKEGREWWKANGAGMRKATFDLHEGSRSMEVLNAYRQERAATKKSISAMTKNPRSTVHGKSLTLVTLDDLQGRVKSWSEADHPRVPSGEHGGEFGSGGGGSKEKPAKGGKRSQEQQPNEKAARAKAAHKMVDKPVQAYCKLSEDRIAKLLGGESFPDSAPMDVATKTDLVEMKTMTLERSLDEKVTMDSYSQIRKVVLEQETGKPFHTIVVDDRKAYSPGGDPSKSKERDYYYRRGIAGSARIGSLHKCKNEAELKKMMAMPEADLPDQAKRTDGKHFVGKWKEIRHADGRKGFRNSKTGVEFFAKK